MTDLEDFVNHVWDDELMSTYSVPRISPPPPPERRSWGRVVLDILYTIFALLFALVAAVVHMLLFFFAPMLVCAWLVLMAFRLASLL